MTKSFTSNDGRVWPVSDKWPVDHPSVPIRENARATLQRIVEHLDGRPLEETFGPGTTLDMVHGNAWRPDMCGCVVHTIHHHYKPETGPIAHRTVAHCDAHAHLTDHGAHYATLRAESGHKEKARAALAAHLGVRHSEIGWSLDPVRALILTHPTVADMAAAATATAAVRAAAPERTVHVVCAGA